MRGSRYLVGALLMCASLAATAAGIFNVGPAQPQSSGIFNLPNNQSPQQKPVPPAGYAPPAPVAQAQQPGFHPPPIPAVKPQQLQQNYAPEIPPEASVVKPLNGDPKVLSQYDRGSNESDEAYISRMKRVYEKSVADMDRAMRDNQAKMLELSAPQAGR